MLNIVNGELFTLKTVHREATENYAAYDIDEFYPTKDIKIDVEKHPNYKLYPITKVYRYDSNGNLQMRFRTNEQTGKTQMQLQQSDRAKYDANVFMVAIPFSGLLLPSEENPLIRIHKATVVSSDAPNVIEWDEKKFTSVAYLIITLDHARMKKEKRESTSMKFVSMSQAKNEAGERVYYSNTITVSFFDDGAFACSPVERAEAPDYVPPEKGAPREKAFKIYEYVERPKKERTKHSYMSAAPEDGRAYMDSRSRRGKF